MIAVGNSSKSVATQQQCILVGLISLSDVLQTKKKAFFRALAELPRVRLDAKVVIELVSIKSGIDLFQTGHLLSRR